MTGDHRWRGYSHQELYARLHAGPGASASANSIGRWAGLASTLSEINQDIHSGISTTGAQWTGMAADRAAAGLTPLGQWALDAQAGADVMKVSAELQAEYVSKARADMPQPQMVTAEKPSSIESGLTHLFGGQTDFEAQEAKQTAAEQRAIEVMTTYESSTASNTSTLGRFTAPPEVVIDAPAPVGHNGGHHGSPVIGRGYVPAGGVNTSSRPTSGAGRTPTAGGGRSTTTSGSSAATSGSSAASGGSSSRAPQGGGPPRTAGRAPASGPLPAQVHPSRPAPATTSAAGAVYEGGVLGGPEAAGRGDSDGHAQLANRLTVGSASGTSSASGTTISSRNGGGTSSPLIPAQLAGGSSRRPDLLGGRDGRGAVDREHGMADYLLETENAFGDGHVVAPPVLGEGPAGG